MGLGIRTRMNNLGRIWRSWFAGQYLVASIGTGCDLKPGCIFECGKPNPDQNYKGIILDNDITIARGVVLTTDSYLPESGITIGDGTSISRNSLIYGGGGVTIGKNVLIAPMVGIWSGGHEFKGASGPVKNQNITLGPIVIGDGAWIGIGAIILANVTIGEGAVIGAGSVVTRDIPPYAIAVGNPAQVMKMRE
jgi:acetyltransferase-like isoleucine patch superfamily enzyme